MEHVESARGTVSGFREMKPRLKALRYRWIRMPKCRITTNVMKAPTPRKLP